MTDPIADMLTRIRNAYMVSKPTVLIPHSKIKLSIAQILKQERYITDVAVVDDNFKSIQIKLRYNKKVSAIENIQRVSKGGRRIYAGKEELPKVLNNYGIAIVSTSKGLMTNKEAHKQGIGGEVLCEIY
jgi:small subunit ribosomal protein S8